MSSVVVDAVEHLVRGIVDNPDDVRVDMVTNRRGRTVEVHVHPDDLGKVIGRGGRTATALRTHLIGAQLALPAGGEDEDDASGGVLLLNQSVLLRGVNDSVAALVALSERLVDLGILPNEPDMKPYMTERFLPRR